MDDKSLYAFMGAVITGAFGVFGALVNAWSKRRDQRTADARVDIERGAAGSRMFEATFAPQMAYYEDLTERARLLESRLDEARDERDQARGESASERARADLLEGRLEDKHERLTHARKLAGRYRKERNKARILLTLHGVDDTPTLDDDEPSIPIDEDNVTGNRAVPDLDGES